MDECFRSYAAWTPLSSVPVRYLIMLVIPLVKLDCVYCPAKLISGAAYPFLFYVFVSVYATMSGVFFFLLFSAIMIPLPVF